MSDELLAMTDAEIEQKARGPRWSNRSAAEAYEAGYFNGCRAGMRAQRARDAEICETLFHANRYSEIHMEAGEIASRAIREGK